MNKVNKVSKTQDDVLRFGQVKKAKTKTKKDKEYANILKSAKEEIPTAAKLFAVALGLVTAVGTFVGVGMYTRDMDTQFTRQNSIREAYLTTLDSVSSLESTISKVQKSISEVEGKIDPASEVKGSVVVDNMNAISSKLVNVTASLVEEDDYSASVVVNITGMTDIALGVLENQLVDYNYRVVSITDKSDGDPSSQKGDVDYEILIYKYS